MIKLKLSGRLPKEIYKGLPEFTKKIKNSVFYLHFEEKDVQEEITQEIINEEFTENSFPYKLLESLAKDEDYDALQMAYEILNEVRK